MVGKTGKNEPLPDVPGAVSGPAEEKSRQHKVDAFKRMCRLLERTRRDFLDDDWRNYAKVIPQQQFIHLMMVRSSLPCNLARIMQLTGLTSAGASIFVNKLVKLNLLARMDDPSDRRNVIIRATPKAAAIITRIEDRLNCYIYGFFDHCTEEELATLESASTLVCRALSASDDESNSKRKSAKKSR